MAPFLKQLLLAIAVPAIAFAICLSFGPAVAVAAFGVLAILAGVTSYRSSTLEPYLAFVASGAIAAFLFASLGMQLTDSGAAFFAIAFLIGLLLSNFSVQGGNWPTQVLGVGAMSAYVIWGFLTCFF